MHVEDYMDSLTVHVDCGRLFRITAIGPAQTTNLVYQVRSLSELNFSLSVKFICFWIKFTATILCIIHSIVFTQIPAVPGHAPSKGNYLEFHILCANQIGIFFILDANHKFMIKLKLKAKFFLKNSDS